MAKNCRQTVAIGLLGIVRDAAAARDRWSRWRPTVSVCMQEDLLVDRYELLYEPKFDALAKRVAKDIRAVSPETTVNLQQIEFGGDPWNFESVFGALYDFADGYDFDPEREDYLIHITTGTHVAQICLFLLTESRHLPGRLLQSSPSKRDAPAGQVNVIDLDLSRYDKLAQRFATAHDEAASLLKSGIATRNANFNRLIDRIEQVGIASTAPILLTGPTGAGKSQLAARLFELKKRRRLVAGEFIEVNCATLRGDAAMSTLFGHRKGAYTGATTDRSGLLMAADKGVLFLDEIGELGVDEQTMLLRALEEGRFFPFGADEEVSSQFQLIAGTNRDLGQLVAQGRFRDDLLARIDLWTFELPGLAERREDIEPNLDYELQRFAAATGQRVGFNKEARQRYLGFAASETASWLGNFRDLNASMTRMATLATGGRIGEIEVEEECARLRHSWSRASPTQASSARDHSELASVLEAEQLEALDLFDRVQLAEVVRVCRRSRSLSEAGRKLFAASRARRKQPNDADRLRKYLARFGLEFASVRT